MNYGQIACLDVYYYGDYAKACGIVFRIEPSERIISRYCKIIESVEEYIPGQFYRRELPCLLEVYDGIGEGIDLIIIDGFVLLGGGKRGLGAHLFEALDRRIPVIGVAKTFFRGCTDYVKIYRGHSNRPLYISCIGTDLTNSAELIRNLGGDNRIPDILKMVDRLTREDIKS
ncbi:MAG: endonuclease V [Tissierellia bacterium]|nr:endonuclease V [Tissierellia bacterium]